MERRLGDHGSCCRVPDDHESIAAGRKNQRAIRAEGATRPTLVRPLLKQAGRLVLNPGDPSAVTVFPHGIALVELERFNKPGKRAKKIVFVHSAYAVGRSQSR